MESRKNGTQVVAHDASDFTAIHGVMPKNICIHLDQCKSY